MVKNRIGSLDTNILLRLVLEDVPEQTRLVEKLFDESDNLYVADIIIFEMVFVLDRVYQFSREQIAKSVASIIRNKKINCNRKLFELSLPLYNTNTKISFVDSTLPYYALLNGTTPLFTFDKALNKACPDSSRVLD